MKYAFFLLTFLVSFSASAQKKDLIITKSNDTLFCKITQIDKVSMTYYETSPNDLKWIAREKVEKYEWNTEKKYIPCDKGYVIKNNGEKITGTLFINTNTFGIELDRPFMNSISNVCLKNEVKYVFNVRELRGFNYCNTMYMRIQTQDSSYQFVELLESGKDLILAKGINPTNYRWKEDKSQWFVFQSPVKKQKNEEFELAEQSLSYVRVKQSLSSTLSSITLPSTPNAPNSGNTINRTTYHKNRRVQYKYAKEVYYLIKKGENPVEVNSNNFSDELENLFEGISEIIPEGTRWTEDGMTQAVEIINNQD